jgi:hypothetical protein
MQSRHPYACCVKFERGNFRWVVLTQQYAIKIPRLRYLVNGMRCNRWEREMWQRWRPIFGWRHLCPVLRADSLGLLVLMPRARTPVTFAEVAAERPNDDYPEATDEPTKPDDYGRIDGQLVALDYGLFAAEALHNQREYYENMAIRRIQAG